MLGNSRSVIASEAEPGILCGGVLNIVAKERPKVRAPVAELKEIVAAIRSGDNLPNTPASLEAKVQRRALLIAVQYEADGRNTNYQSLFMPTSPRDVLRVYRMLLNCGYDAQNIRILVEGVVSNDLSHATKRNIMDSLEWLCQSAEAGDYRYLHFSGHGYAYEVEGRGGKVARMKSMSAESPEPLDPGTCGKELLPLLSGGQDKFYREGLLTEWRHPSFEETWNSEIPIRLDDHNRIEDEELTTMIAKLPEGCVLTMTLDCFHGGEMDNVNLEPPRNMYRGGAGRPIAELEDDQSSTNLSGLNLNSSPRNLFVPPEFYLYSEFHFDPKVKMGRVQGPEPLHGIKATVLIWSAYRTSHSQTGVFTSAFTGAVQDLEGNTSCHELFQEIRRRVGEATEKESGHPIIQLLPPWNEGSKQPFHTDPTFERAGSSGNSEVSASSIIVPTRAPGMSVATMSTSPASPEVQSITSTIRTSSVTDMADDDDLSIGSDDSLDPVWEEVRRRGQGHLPALDATCGG